MAQPQHCLFCCTPLPPQNKRKRCRQLGKIGEFVVKHCQETRYLYPRLASLRGEGRTPICLPCVNWQRRCAQGQRKRCQGRRPYLLMDHFALFMLSPGQVHVPDQRCALRLVQALLGGHGGGLLHSLPVQVQCMVQRIKPQVGLTVENLLHHLMAAWWDYNGRTPFISHHLTAKLVRRMVKDLGRGG